MAAGADVIARGDLAERLYACSREADRRGALVPLATRVHTIADGGIEFVVRVAERWRDKPRANEPGKTAAQQPSDPFLPPYERALYVGAISATHVGLLNKYPVLDAHLLLVTRAFEEQTAALTAADCAALLRGLYEIDGLAFYNGGPEAGASQPHKHLQLVPLPLGPGALPLPSQPWLEAAHLADDGVGRNPELPFAHAVARMPADWLAAPEASGSALRALYRRMWAFLGEDAQAPGQPRPFNLLATRDWIWLVPRRREGVAGLSVNALAYAGALLAGDDARLERLRAMGPLGLLAQV